MADPTIAPFGSWKSPITPASLAGGGVYLGAIQQSGASLYWGEVRPAEKGRTAIARRAADGTMSDAVPPGFNARTRVHEYGGGAWRVLGSTLYASNFDDSRLYRIEPGQTPQPITPEPEIANGLRYADLRFSVDGKWIVCVRETHHANREATNEIVTLPADGSAPPRVLATGRDFYSDPRLSPDGKRLCWLQWDHPNMPWDGTELWVSEFSPDGASGQPRQVAGGKRESICQPDWSADGTLHFISDRTDWWNLYAEQNGQIVPLAPLDAEFGGTQWVFGLSYYAFLSGGRIACAWTQQGRSHLGIIEPGSGRAAPLDTPYAGFHMLHSDGSDRLWFDTSGFTEPTALVMLDTRSGQHEVIRRSREAKVDPGYISVAQPIEYPTENGLTAHALFYPPQNKDFAPSSGTRPPLLVMSHGGPTGHTTAEFNLDTQFWTSRGIAVVDVNYGGSTGYGRPYRERLNGQWGLVDMHDCANAAKYLAAQGMVDGGKLAITGGSAGGYTTLCALTFLDTFKVGASYFGIGDLETMARDTHKFESRYLDTLVGPYPAAQDVYKARSPIHFIDRVSCPVILLQGLDDKIVPPNQAQDMANALKYKELPYALVTFEGEGHGFRKADNIQRSIEAELYFYSRIFNFELADPVEPVEIENL